MRTSSCFGILLAGGLARRMGGGDKALRKLGGIPLLARAIAALRPQCEGLVLSANGDPERFAGFDLPIVADDVPRLTDARAKDNALIACARSGGRTHQAVAVWPVSMRFDLRHALVVENIRKVEAFLQNYSRAIVEWPTLPYDPFFNANDPSDLAAAEAILARRDNRLA